MSLEFGPPYSGINPNDEALVAQSELFELRAAGNLGQTIDQAQLDAAEQRVRDLVMDANTSMTSVGPEAIVPGEAITRDLLAQVDRGEITEAQAEEVLFRLGLFHRSEGGYD